MQSPRLATLIKKLVGDPNALEKFWQNVSGEGTPIVEPLANDRANLLVTFVYRGNKETEVAFVKGGPGGFFDNSRGMLNRLPRTDIWFRSYVLPASARFSYQVAVNFPLFLPGDFRYDDENLLKLQSSLQVDPLNLTPYPDRHTPHYSAVALPNAPGLLYTAPRPGVLSGRLDEHRVRSRILGNDRVVRVYCPAGYDPGGSPCPLVVLLDGQAFLNLIPAATIVDNLATGEKVIPPPVTVMIGSLPDRRISELCNNEAFGRFVAEELLTWIREHYQVSRDPGQVILGGCSFGGLAAAYIALQRPDLFGNVLAQSGTFGWPGPNDSEPGWLMRQYARASQLPGRFYLDVGQLDNERNSLPAFYNWPSNLQAVRHMRDVLVARGCELHYREFVGGHDHNCWAATLADGLLYLNGRAPSL